MSMQNGHKRTVRTHSSTNAYIHAYTHTRTVTDISILCHTNVHVWVQGNMGCRSPTEMVIMRENICQALPRRLRMSALCCPPTAA